MGFVKKVKGESILLLQFKFLKVISRVTVTTRRGPLDLFVLFSSINCKQTHIKKEN